MIGAYLALFLLMLLAGIPIYLTMGVTGALMFGSDGSLLAYAQKLIDELNSSTLIAVPYFVIAATFMERGGVARALIEAAEAWIGRVHGGLGLVAVLSCTIFAAMCGSSVATAIAMGTILVPAMIRGALRSPVRRRHRRRLRYLGHTGAAFSCVRGVRRSRGRVDPEAVSRRCHSRPAAGRPARGLHPLGESRTWLQSETSLDLRQKAARTVRAVPALGVPVLVLGGLYGGIVTLTESAALSAVVAIVLSLFVYRGLRPGQLLPVMALSVRNAAAIMIIIAVALAFGHWITETGIANKAVGLIDAWGVQGWQFLIAINLILLLLGMFLQVYSVMLLMVPILLPLLGPLGIDPLHFGVVIVINMEIALLTPPVGLNLFVIANISNTPLAQVVQGHCPLCRADAGIAGGADLHTGDFAVVSDVGDGR